MFDVWSYLWWPFALIFLVGSLAFDAWLVDKLESVESEYGRAGSAAAGPLATAAMTVNKWWPWQLVPLWVSELIVLGSGPWFFSAPLLAASLWWTWFVLRGHRWRLNSTTVMREDERERVKNLGVYTAAVKLCVVACFIMYGVFVPIFHLFTTGTTLLRMLHTMYPTVSIFQ
jgi:hypothetical protein